MEKPVCVVVLRDNSLTSYPPAHMRSRVLSVVHLGYEHNLCYYCRMGESVSSETTGAYALLSLVTGDE